MSKAKSVLGKDLMLFIDGKAIALATSCKLGLSAETIDTPVSYTHLTLPTTERV